MRTDSRISVIIPALNEAASITSVLGDIPEWVDQVIVSDNGSTDDTVAIAEENGATVVHEPQRGYGAACLRGIQALDNPDIVVFLDGDYSDHPDQMDILVDPIIEDQVDMVIGSRTLGNPDPGALTPQARHGNKLACFLIKLFWGVRYTDLGPFRAIRYSSLQQLHMIDTNYGWTVEMQIKAALHKLRTTEVPVDYRKRIGQSKVSGTLRGVLGASYKILATIFLSAARYHLRDKKYASTKHRLIIFTRYPEPGKTKTRLIPELGPEGAANLQKQLTEHALRTAASLANTQIEIHYTGATKTQMVEWLGDAHTYREQHPGNLGDRMFDALKSTFDSGTHQAIVIGIDSPAITSSILQTAFLSLNKNAVTIGPATDGGYYLIGASYDTPPVPLGHIFHDIEWGTETVYAETLARLNSENIPWHRLAYLNDIDEPNDLQEWDRQNANKSLPDLSIIIPTLNEAQNVEEAIQSARTKANIEILIADGGSTDDTTEIATKQGAKIITAPKGRALQMNHAVAHAASETLLFLHADTRLPENFLEEIRSTLDEPNTVCGAFRFETDEATLSMKIITFVTNLRSKYRQLPYGDQAFFMKKETFQRVSGYLDLPIMEDYIIMKKLKKMGRIRICDTPITTSARRWHEKGPWRTTLKNQLTILTYNLGRDLTKIADSYRRK